MAGKLSKLSMPKKGEEADLGIMGMEDEGEMEMEMEVGPASDEGASPLAEVSDEDLMAEVRKRGLSAKLSKPEDGSDEEY